MPVLFEGSIPVHYGFLYLHGTGGTPDLDASRGGQVNGLCGAADPAGLTLITGLHTGEVPVTVEALEAVPDLDERWEDVVEVSFRPTTTELLLSAFQDSVEVSLPRLVGLRVRYSGRGMDQARAADTRMAGEPELDRYLLQLWPDEVVRADEVVRQTSQIAGYWHGVARPTRPPAPPPAPAQIAAAQAEGRRAEAAAEASAAWSDRVVWGEVSPSPTVRAVGGRTAQVFRVNAALVEHLARLTAAQQRAVAVDVARAACRHSGVDSRDAVVAALDAARRGEPLPPPFDQARTAFDALISQDGDQGSHRLTGATASVRASSSAGRQPLDPRAAAAGALLGAGHPDPLLAAIEALADAAAGQQDEAAYLEGIRQDLP
jgi:hypothetical protein